MTENDESRGRPDGRGGGVVAHDLPEAEPPSAAYICDSCNAYPAGDPRVHDGAPCPYCPGELRRYELVVRDADEFEGRHD